MARDGLSVGKPTPRFYFFFALFYLAFSPHLRAVDITLSWDANKEADIAGYMIYLGNAPGNYDSQIYVGKVTTHTLSKLGVGRYYFVVTAFNTSGAESNPSNEVFIDIPAELTVYYTHLSSSDTNGQIEGTLFDGLALSNFDAGDAFVLVTAFSADGSIIAGADITNPAVRILSPGEQIAIVDFELFGPGISADSIDYVRIECNTSQITGFFLIFNSDLTILNGAAYAVAANSFILSEIQDSGSTWIRVTNPGNGSVAPAFQLVNPSGNILASRIRNIEPNAAVTLNVATDLFPDTRIAGADYIRVNASQGVVPFEFLQGKSRSVQVLNGQEISTGSAVLYSPQYAVGGPWRTTISVVNLDDTAGNVTFRLFSDNGTCLGWTEYSIAPRGKIWVTDQSFLVPSTTSVTSGYVLIEGTNTHLTGSIVFSDREEAIFATGFPLATGLTSSAVFSQFASDDTYYTGMAVVNPHDTEMNLSLEVYAQSGELVARYPFALPPGQRSTGLLSEYFPDLGNMSSGYIRLVADLGFASYVVFGTHNMTALTAVPAQVIR